MSSPIKPEDVRYGDVFQAGMLKTEYLVMFVGWEHGHGVWTGLIISAGKWPSDFLRLQSKTGFKDYPWVYVE